MRSAEAKESYFTIAAPSSQASGNAQSPEINGRRPAKGFNNQIMSESEAEKELVRLWRAWRTAREMCADRVSGRCDGDGSTSLTLRYAI